jgi:hypothetical protein
LQHHTLGSSDALGISHRVSHVLETWDHLGHTHHIFHKGSHGCTTANEGVLSTAMQTQTQEKNTEGGNNRWKFRNEKPEAVRKYHNHHKNKYKGSAKHAPLSKYTRLLSF